MTQAFRPETPSDGPSWLPRLSDSIVSLFKRIMPAPFRTAQYTTANRPLAADWMGGVIFDVTDNRLAYSNGSAWFELMSYTAGAALTEVNDTNVTLTLGGTPATALLQAVSITAGWTGRLAYGRFIAATQKSLVGATAAGDFGEVTLGSGLALVAGVLSATGGSGTVTSVSLSAPLGGGTVTTSGTLGTTTFTNHGVLLGQATSAIVATAAGAANTFLAGVAGADPTFRAVNLASADVSGILPGANGGTNNGFMQFSGPSTSLKTFTLPNASDTIGCLGQTQSWTAKQTFTTGLDSTGATASIAANIIFRGRSGGAAATTGLRLLDTDDSNTLRVVCSSDLTTNRTLNFAVSDSADRTLDISAANVTVTVSGAALTALTIAQGDIIYGTGAGTAAILAKSATATRYLSNTGTTNNPAWAQVDLTNGVTGVLPSANGGTGNAGGAWTAFTPTITSGIGSIMTVSVSGAYQIVGKTMNVRATVTIAVAGTGAGALNITNMPGTATVRQFVGGVEDALSTNTLIVGKTTAGSTNLEMTMSGGVTVIATGARIQMTGAYEIS